MKYVKSFSIFESETVNEAVATPAKVLPKETGAKIKAEVDKLDPAKKEQLKSELIQLALKLKLKTVDELQDVTKVGDALLKAGLVKESFEFSADDINEGIVSGLKNWWKRAKDTVYKWMVKMGVTGLIGGIVTTAIAAEFMPNPDIYTYSQTVDPNTGVIVGLTAAAIGLVSLCVGLKGTGELGAAASGAAAGRR
jgi:hypothetical protein